MLLPFDPWTSCQNINTHKDFFQLGIQITWPWSICHDASANNDTISIHIMIEQTYATKHIDDH